MIVGLLTLRFYAPEVHSLKEKRMIVQSLCTKLQNKFHVTVAEADCQDLHETIVIAIACLAATTALCDSMFDHIIGFAEETCEAELVDVQREWR